MLLGYAGSVFHPGNIKVFMQNRIASVRKGFQNSHTARTTGSTWKPQGKPPLPIRQRLEPTANILAESLAISERLIAKASLEQPHWNLSFNKLLLSRGKTLPLRLLLPLCSSYRSPTSDTPEFQVLSKIKKQPGSHPLFRPRLAVETLGSLWVVNGNEDR